MDTRNATASPEEIARNLAYWAAQPKGHYVGSTPAERLAMAKFAGYKAPKLRDDEDVNTGVDLEAGPASLDISPELADEYKAIARESLKTSSVRVLERYGMADDESEAALAAEREASDAKEFAALEHMHLLRESAYVRHVRNRSGEVATAEVFAKSLLARERLEGATLEIAGKLAAVGRSVKGTGPQAWIVDLISGKSKPLINVKKRAFLPTVAAQKRAPMIAALEFILRNKAHRYDKLCTFTFGRRVPLIVESGGAELRAALIGLQRGISKMNAEPFMRDASAQIIFRASEVGSLFDVNGKPNQEKGIWMLHPHAHTIVHFDRWLSDSQYARWHTAVWSHWVHQWDNAGALDNIREACKYPVKPSDLQALSPMELAALDTALFRLHRVQPLGELREQIGDRWERCLTVKRERRTKASASGGTTSHLVPAVLTDWNAQKPNRIADPETLEDIRHERQKWTKKFRAFVEALEQFRPANSDGQVLIDFKCAPFNRRSAVRFAEILLKRKTPKFAPSSVFAVPFRSLLAVARGRASLFPAAVMPSKPMAYTPESVKGVSVAQLRAVLRGRASLFPRFIVVVGSAVPPAWENRVVARLSPSTYFDRVSSPAVLVWSTSRPTLAGILEPHAILNEKGEKSGFLQDAINASAKRVNSARALVAAEKQGGAAALGSVHTIPVTVRDSGAEKTPYFDNISSDLAESIFEHNSEPKTAQTRHVLKQSFSPASDYATQPLL